MKKNIGISRIYRVIFFITLLLGMIHPTSARADGDPRRYESINVVYTEYDWWLVYWQDNDLACEITVDHEGEPTGVEIYQQCGDKFYDLWSMSVPCSNAGSGEQEQCEGMYLFQVGSGQNEKVIQVELPTAKIWIEINDCIHVRSTDICEDIPSLLITAQEPLPNERISRIQGTLNELPFVCFGDSCDLELRVPAVVKLGVMQEAAHLFVFYFAILSAITPPVALAVYAANSLSGAGIWASSWAAVKLGLTGYIVPFMFVFGPSLLMIGEVGVIAATATSAIIGVVLLAGGLHGYLIAPASVWQRTLLIMAAFCLIKPGIETDLTGAALTAVVLVAQFLALRAGVTTARKTAGE